MIAENDASSSARPRVRLARAALMLWCAGVAAAPRALATARAAQDVDRVDAAETAERRLQEIEKTIAALQAEIARLRSAAAPAGASPATLPDLEKKIDALTREIERLRMGEAASPPEAGAAVPGHGPAASKVYRSPRGVSIGGYGEMLYQNPDGRTDAGVASGRSDTLDFLRAVLYFGYKFDEKFVFNSEVEYEHAFVEGGAESGEVALEFAYIDYRPRRAFGVRGGLLLIPVGFLNELHEPPIFFGARRPEVERNILPSTWRENGAGVYGDVGPVSYRAYIVAGLDASGFAAGDGFRGGRQSGSESLAQDLALTARIDWTPVPGLLVGMSAYSGEAAQGDAALEGAGLTVWDAHLDWNARGWHLRGLYARASVDDARAINLANGAAVDGGVGSRLFGWYGEAAYNVLGGRSQELSPFVRYERFDTQDEVPAGFVANPANDRTVKTWGVRYRPIPNIALKLDYIDFKNEAGTGVDQFNFALGYLF